LPDQPFEAATWKKVGLNIDYHIEFDHHLELPRSVDSLITLLRTLESSSLQ
jgi:hypothetical protein